MSRRPSQHSEEAHKRAVRGGIIGGAQYLVAGSVLGTIFHYSWNTFRRITIPGKAYLLTSFILVGVWVNADKEMVAYERAYAQSQSADRRAIYDEIFSRGSIPNESQVRQELEKRQRRS